MSFENIIAASTLTSIGLAAFHHVGYPLLLKIAEKRSTDPIRPILDPAKAPEVTLVIPAFQEASYIDQKLSGLTRLEYPTNRLTILVICDGCSDDTAVRARRWDDALGAAGIKLKVIDHGCDGLRPVVH